MLYAIEAFLVILMECWLNRCEIYLTIYSACLLMLEIMGSINSDQQLFSRIYSMHLECNVR